MSKKTIVSLLIFSLLFTLLLFLPSRLFAESVIMNDPDGVPTLNAVTYDNGEPVLAPYTHWSNNWNNIRDYFIAHGASGNPFYVKSSYIHQCPSVTTPGRNHIDPFYLRDGNGIDDAEFCMRQSLKVRFIGEFFSIYGLDYCGNDPPDTLICKYYVWTGFNGSIEPAPEANEGPSCDNTGNLSKPVDIPSHGSPVWEVNKVNMNLYLTDTPLWYDPAVGPSVKINLSYNSRGDITGSELFGNKWIFNYESYLSEDATSGNVTVYMPGGRKDVYTPNGLGGYNSPEEIYNTLTKNAAYNFTLELSDGTTYLYAVESGIRTKLTEIEDANGRKLTFGYSGGILSTITDAENNVTTLIDTFSDGLIDQVTDPFGRSAYFEYDTVNFNLTKITDMGGLWTSFTYDTGAYLSSLSNANGTWDFYIEPADGIYNGADPYPPPGGNMWNNYRITVTDPYSNKEEYYYMAGENFVADSLTWHVSPENYVEYADAANNNYNSSVPKTKYQYVRTDAGTEGRIAKIEYPGGGFREHEYDTNGNLSLVRDTHGHETAYAYNASGRLVTETDANGSATTNVYDANNIDLLEVRFNKTSTPEDDNILLRSFTYDPGTHDVKTITDAVGVVTDYTYNTDRQLQAITQAKNTAVEMVTENVYDPFTKKLAAIKKNGNTITSFTYDSLGRVESVTDASGITIEYRYDDFDRVTKILYPDTIYNGSVPASKYVDITYTDWNPHLVKSRTDRSGLITNYVYDANKRLTSVTGPDGTIRYEYDADGRMTALIDADQKVTRFEYDLDGRLKKKIFYDNKFVTYTYDTEGLFTNFTNARGMQKNYTLYDANHNLRTIDYSDTTPDVSFAYDDYNRLMTMTDGIGTYGHTYYDDNKLQTIDGPWANDTITYSYNALGQMTSMTPQGGQAVAYAYDTMGRLTDITKGTDAFSYSYTGVNSLVQSLTRPNGSVTDYLYMDVLMRLTDVVNKNSSLQVINGNSFSYNDHDLIETETITNALPVTPPTSGVKVYSNNNVNQLMSVTSPNQAFAYNNDGNMTQSYTPAGYEMTMAYDAENRLTSAEYTDNLNVIHKTEYSYSGNNLLARIKKYENGVMADEMRFVRAEFLPLQERDGDNLVMREYLWGIDKGGGIGGLLSLKENGQDYFYLYDGKGNVAAVMDNNEQVVASYRYDEFGNVLSQVGSRNQPFRFSTKQYDEDTGLYYYGYRYYSPSIGKWITRDPIGEYGGIDLYGFVTNNAINLYDPLGLAPQKEGCDRIPNILETRCIRNCCDIHDSCYEKHDCSEKSWKRCWDGNPNCKKCNKDAVKCATICFITGRGPGGPISGPPVTWPPWGDLLLGY